MIVDDQKETVEFLKRPQSYGLPGPVEAMETHISRIFLVGDRAFKVKRAVSLPYVDFSTPALRFAACEKEVARNSPTAPGLYLRVRRVVRRADGLLAFDAKGDLVEPVIEMRRFAQEALFDAIARAGDLDAAMTERVVAMTVRFHERAPVVTGESGADNLAAVLDINRRGFATSHVFSDEQVEAFDTAFRARLERHRRLLDARAEAGWLRLCHGDLHLRNICLLDGEPRLFDCIEFNETIATVDVLYDLAFLLMDLWHRGFADLANLAANRYLDATGQAEGFVLLPFLMAIRAAVRAHVTATQVEEGTANAAHLTREARAYFDLAKMLLEERPPRLVAVGGFSGSGKTTIAEVLAPKVGVPPGARIIESDRVRKQMYGVAPETRLDAAAYGPDVSERVYAEMARRCHAVLAAGGSVVVDAVFDDPARRDLIARSVGGTDARFDGFWLEADENILRARVAARRGGPSDATLGVLEGQLARGAGPLSWERVAADGATGEIAGAILARIV